MTLVSLVLKQAAENVGEEMRKFYFSNTAVTEKWSESAAQLRRNATEDYAKDFVEPLSSDVRQELERLSGLVDL